MKGCSTNNNSSSNNNNNNNNKVTKEIGQKPITIKKSCSTKIHVISQSNILLPFNIFEVLRHTRNNELYRNYSEYDIVMNSLELGSASSEMKIYTTH
jgi:hypothetical protein